MNYYLRRQMAKAKRLKHEKELMTTDYERLMEKARKTNAERDKGDKESGFSSPGETSLSVHIQTAMAAIEAGISTSDWNAVAEGQAMLEAILGRVRKSEE